MPKHTFKCNKSAKLLQNANYILHLILHFKNAITNNQRKLVLTV